MFSFGMGVVTLMQIIWLAIAVSAFILFLMMTFVYVGHPSRSWNRPYEELRKNERPITHRKVKEKDDGK
jgi:hypothetical protein